MTAEQTIQCPVCHYGSLSPETGAIEVKHRDQRIRISAVEFYSCDSCDATPVMPDQVKRNDRRIVDAKRYADGLLTGDAIVTIRKSLALSQSEAAELFGGGRNAFSKYERSEIIQSTSMDRLLRLVADYPFLLVHLRMQAGYSVETYANDAIFQRSSFYVTTRHLYESTGLRPGIESHKIVIEEDETWHYQGKAA